MADILGSDPNDRQGSLLGWDRLGLEIKSKEGELTLEDHLLLEFLPDVTLIDKVRMRLGRPIFLGRFRKVGHAGYIKYFAFRCSFCGQIAVSHPMGHEDRPECNRCN